MGISSLAWGSKVTCLGGKWGRSGAWGRFHWGSPLARGNMLGHLRTGICVQGFAYRHAMREEITQSCLLKGKTSDIVKLGFPVAMSVNMALSLSRSLKRLVQFVVNDRLPCTCCDLCSKMTYIQAVLYRFCLSMTYFMFPLLLYNPLLSSKNRVSRNWVQTT